jgi:hypothetical protein
MDVLNEVLSSANAISASVMSPLSDLVWMRDGALPVGLTIGAVSLSLSYLYVRDLPRVKGSTYNSNIVLTVVHSMHYWFVFFPLATAVVAAQRIMEPSFQSRCFAPSLLPVSIAMTTTAYLTAILHHESVSWQFSGPEVEKDPVFQRNIAHMFILQTVSSELMSIAVAGCSITTVLTILLPVIALRRDWQQHMGAIMVPVSLVQIREYYCKAILLNSTPQAVLLFFIAGSIAPGIQQLTNTGDQRWHLLEAIMALVLYALFHYFLIEVPSSLEI